MLPSVDILRLIQAQRDGTAMLRGHVSHKRYVISTIEGRKTGMRIIVYN